ncbi:MAG: ZIP family metal transporter [Ruminococcaceae bacterium]|nr:ZIP family metal transporter [Oscillospiraceae bacterium]
MFTEIFLVLFGIFLPFFGTALGAGAVWLVPRRETDVLRKSLYGFAAGVMLASLVWSLLIPSLERSRTPTATILGFLGGIVFFLLSDSLFERAAKKNRFTGNQKMAFAVTLHNVPEGMAVGVAFARALTDPGSALDSAFLLSVGITLQNLPEGSIISAPLSALGKPKRRAFAAGVLSGVVEPVGALLALLLTSLIEGLLPFVLSFAAGAMLYVAADELIPSLDGDSGKKTGLFSLGLGFALMMAMDVIFG